MTTAAARTPTTTGVDLQVRQIEDVRGTPIAIRGFGWGASLTTIPPKRRERSGEWIDNRDYAVELPKNDTEIAALLERHVSLGRVPESWLELPKKFGPPNGALRIQACIPLAVLLCLVQPSRMMRLFSIADELVEVLRAPGWKLEWSNEGWLNEPGSRFTQLNNLVLPDGRTAPVNKCARALQRVGYCAMLHSSGWLVVFWPFNYKRILGDIAAFYRSDQVQ